MVTAPKFMLTPRTKVGGPYLVSFSPPIAHQRKRRGIRGWLVLRRKTTMYGITDWWSLMLFIVPPSQSEHRRVEQCQVGSNFGRHHFRRGRSTQIVRRQHHYLEACWCAWMYYLETLGSFGSGGQCRRHKKRKGTVTYFRRITIKQRPSLLIAAVWTNDVLPQLLEEI